MIKQTIDKFPNEGKDCKNIEYKRVKMNPRMKDLTGIKFGRLTPLFTVERPGCKYKHWLCLCTCGNLKIVLPSNLTKGRICSCGCIRSETTRSHITKINHERRLDLKNKIFGSLLVLNEEPEVKENTRHYYWKCLCQNCGNITKVRSDILTSGNKIYCDYCNENISQGERKILKILKENNINFVSQKTFPTCRFPDTNFPAKFDFYVENKYIIEFDGRQHFKDYGDYYFDVNKIKEHDAIKNEWCFKNNIPIIRVPYYHLDKITINDLRLETSCFIMKGEQYETSCADVDR